VAAAFIRTTAYGWVATTVCRFFIVVAIFVKLLNAFRSLERGLNIYIVRIDTVRHDLKFVSGVLG
jgi:predicted small integral membrane protein